MTENLVLNDLDEYIPSSSEKKQAVLMYMLVGLLLSTWKREVSPYTYHHIKQSRGWSCFFVIVFFVCIFLLLFWLIIRFALPFFLFLIALNIITMMSLWWMCIFQAWQWKYVWENEIVNKFFAFFSWIWNWVLNLFDRNHFQVIDEERYRKPEEFCRKEEKKQTQQPDNNSNNNSENINNSETVWQTDISSINDWNLWIANSENSSNWWNSLDNNQQIPTMNQNIWIDLSGHEINNPENQLW